MLRSSAVKWTDVMPAAILNFLEARRLSAENMDVQILEGHPIFLVVCIPGSVDRMPMQILTHDRRNTYIRDGNRCERR